LLELGGPALGSCIVTDAEQVPASRRANRLRLAGILIILLAAGAALLPVLWGSAGSAVVGAMLVAAGFVEFLAGAQRRQVKKLASAAGAVTVLAGILFLINPVAHLARIVNLIIGWLVLRSIILFLTAKRTGGSVRTWTIISAATDFALAAVLAAGLSIGTLIVLLFGATPQLVASFAWALALSFVLNGLLQLEIAGCERDSG